MTISPLDLLLEKIIAEAPGETLRGDPDELFRTELKASVLLSEQGGTLVPLPDGSLPREVRGLIVGAYPLILGAVQADDVASALAEIRRFSNQAAVARTWLPPEQADNLQIFLVGPVGSDTASDWRNLQSRVERDEQICRKLIWLPPADEVARNQSLTAFLARTVLVRPWGDDDAAPSGRLDVLESLARAPLAPGLPPDLTVAWRDILFKATEASEQTAAALIAALEKHQ